MNSFSKKRLLVVGGAITTVGAAAALVAGATFGFFSSAGVASGSNTFTAGNVVVGLGAGTQVTCAIGPMSPGDTQAKSGNAACEYDIQYTGNVNAYLALDLSITGAPGSPIAVPYNQTTAPTAAQGLYDGTANGLQFTISDGTTTYMTGVQYTNEAGVATTLTPTSGTAAITQLLVNTTPVTNGGTKHFTVNYSLPTSAGNAYNLATSSIVLRVHAVQADNNTIPGTCALGESCLSATWS